MELQNFSQLIVESATILTETGIFTRRMVDQAREGLCCQKKHNIFSILNKENRTILTYRNLIRNKFLLFVLTLDHIGNAFLYF